MKSSSQLQGAKKIACFTDEQQDAFERLSLKQRLFVEYRARGMTKAEAYKQAGFSSARPIQAAYKLESTNKAIRDLIGVLKKQLTAKDLSDINNEDANKTLKALASQEKTDKYIDAFSEMDSETAKRVLFYRDIIAGRIKTVKKTTKRNGDGEILQTTVEEISDVSAKVAARKELDKILGLNALPELNTISMGDITIHIVDASKRDELENSANAIRLKDDDITVEDVPEQGESEA